MAWYAAHNIEYLKILDEPQESYEVYENIVLIEATTIEEGFAKAKEFGKKEEVEIELADGKKGRWTYLGVRALVECQDVEPESLIQPPDFKPTNGTEVTYISLKINSEEDLQKLVKGESVSITLNDIGPFDD